MNNNIICSIIMPSYNSEKYISKSIESVLKQTFTEFEFIIIDDGSIDKSPQIIKQYANKDMRIVFLQNIRNKGVAATRNEGIKISKGKYLAFIDCDDIWLPEKLEKQIKVLETYNNIALVYSSYQIIDEQNRIIKNKVVPITITFNQLLKENIICLSSICFIKRLTDNNLMDSKYFHEDFCFLLNGLRCKFTYAGIEEILLKYRVSSDGRSHNKKNAAYYRWLIYRNFLKLNLLKSIYYFLWYFINGVKKYYLK